MKTQNEENFWDEKDAREENSLHLSCILVCSLLTHRYALAHTFTLVYAYAHAFIHALAYAYAHALAFTNNHTYVYPYYNQDSLLFNFIITKFLNLNEPLKLLSSKKKNNILNHPIYIMKYFFQ